MKLTLRELLQRRPAPRPILLLRVDHVEGHPVRDHHRIPGSGKTQQQTGFFFAFLGRRTDVLGRLSDVFLRFLRDREQFDGLFIMSPKSFEDFHQRLIRSRGEHFLRLFPRLEKYRHDQ
ncbi:hypothetical protein ACFQ51_56510 [Streptomyces kaempferi]